MMAMKYDPQEDLYYMEMPDGSKNWISPKAFETDPTGKGTGHGHPDSADKGGGFFHGHPTWNTETHKFDVGLDWGKVLSYVAAGIITAGAADAIMGASAGTAASLLGPELAATGGGVAPETIAALGMSTLPEVGAVAGTTGGVLAGLPGEMTTLPATTIPEIVNHASDNIPDQGPIDQPDYTPPSPNNKGPGYKDVIKDQAGKIDKTKLALGLLGIGGNALEGLFQQKRKSFEGTAVDPVKMLTEANSNIRTLGKSLSNNLQKGVNLRSAYAQQPPVIAGGGLVGPVGVSGQDPALSDPSLLSLPGIDLGGLFGADAYQAPTKGGPQVIPVPPDAPTVDFINANPGEQPRIMEKGPVTKVSNVYKRGGTLDDARRAFQMLGLDV